MFDTPRGSEEGAHHAARAKNKRAAGLEDLFGQPTRAPAPKSAAPANGPSAPLLVDAATAARLLGIGRSTLDALTRKGDPLRATRKSRVVPDHSAPLHREWRRSCEVSCTKHKPLVRFDVNEIPPSMRVERRWVNWRAELRDDKWTKVPCGADRRPVDGSSESSG